MGAWGAGNFENDTAADWAADLVDGGSEDLVRDALRTAVEAAELEALEACEALAAAEVVAAAAGHGMETAGGDDAEAVEWGARHPELADDETVQLARAAIDAVAAPASELAQLWAESTDDGSPDPDWTAALEDLRRRLTA